MAPLWKKCARKPLSVLSSRIDNFFDKNTLRRENAASIIRCGSNNSLSFFFHLQFTKRTQIVCWYVPFEKKYVYVCIGIAVIVPREWQRWKTGRKLRKQKKRWEGWLKWYFWRLATRLLFCSSLLEADRVNALLWIAIFKSFSDCISSVVGSVYIIRSVTNVSISFHSFFFFFLTACHYNLQPQPHKNSHRDNTSAVGLLYRMKRKQIPSSLLYTNCLFGSFYTIQTVACFLIRWKKYGPINLSQGWPT